MAAQPPPVAPLPLEEVLAFHSRMRDVTGEPISALTTLVPLHQNGSQLVRNLSGLAQPYAPCFIVASDDRIFPQEPVQCGTEEPPYRIGLTCKNLLTAPVLRVVCQWDGLHANGRNLQVALDFHFNGGIDQFSVKAVERLGQLKDEITFTAHDATSEGFPLADRRRNEIGPHGRAALSYLRSLLEPDSPQPLRFRFFAALHEQTLGTLIPYLTGTGVEKLESLSSPEWGSLLPLKPDRNLLDFINAPAPFPLVPFDTGDTYSTITEASVQLYESARIAHEEVEVALRQWSYVIHRGILYRIGGVVVMSVKSSALPIGILKADLPERLQAKIMWTDSITGDPLVASGTRCLVPIALPTPGDDILFVIEDPTPNIVAAASAPSEFHPQLFVDVTCEPIINKSLLERQLNTAHNLTSPDSARWHKMILNQSHDMPTVDLATSRIVEPDVDPSLIQASVDAAWDWLLNWRTWNAEQVQALHSIRSAVGGIVLITAPAGCGKTLILEAICVFLYRLGLHVMVLAPANSNCADFMRKLVQLFPDLTPVRVFPASKDFNVKKLGKEREKIAEPTSTEGTPDLLEFELVRADLQSGEKYSSFKDYGLPAQVLKAARESRYTLKQELGGEELDVWQELRRFIEASDDNSFDWSDKSAIQQYQAAYDSAKAHYVALTRLIVTTTGNVRSPDIMDSFASDKHGLKCEGIVVLLDEAGKDREIESCSALVHPNLRKKIVGFVMVGDERQLVPTNTSARGNTQFNPFIDRLSMPLLGRLKRQGWPCVELVEQHRMSATISEWPSNNFYRSEDGGPTRMRNGTGTNQLLSEKQPGLFKCLQKILRGLRKHSHSPLIDLDDDRVIRSHYINVVGKRDKSKQSVVAREHIRIFFQKVFWYLLKYYGEKMEENVMVICAYKESRNCWIEAANYLQRKHQLPSVCLPRILTIDSSQGAESQVCILDCSVQAYHPRSSRADIGFVDDDKRINVAFTRAQEVRWVLGGDCKYIGEAVRWSSTPAYVRYRDETENSADFKCVSVVKNQRLRADSTWLDRLERPVINLDTCYADDLAR